MISRLGCLATVCGLAGVFATGCGTTKTVTVTTAVGTNPATATTTAPAGTTSPAATTGPAGTTGPTTNPSPAERKAIIARAVALCKTTVNGQPTLSASAKSQLDGVCDKTGTGNVSAVRTAAYQVCQEIIRASFPAGAARTQGLAACPKP